jgi:cell division septum initiation protein DivIVA
MSSHKLPPERRPPASAADAAERLARIVDAAERAAADVIDDAEEQAQQQLADARARADRIVAERLRQLADQLDPPTAAPLDAGEGRGSHLRPVERPGAEHLAPRPSEPSAARLLATQMAVSGSSRQEIEARLRAAFDIESTSEILDAILGPEE